MDREHRERTERVEAIAKAEAPGSMPDFITYRIEEGPRGLQGVAVCTHPAVRFALDGTRSHTIVPRRAKALRFDIGGRIVFARVVRHPGTRPKNFDARALPRGR
ncbi:hypothetical protein [Actinacidiphila acidipaludis]|uniref:hypothetical protein n=1 Tax=Actinacidiphila acidipaludis TaxID=2873382 RepID=UPI00223C1B3D|nr:hypothetical protein [Streptomyces acidipaludis]